MLSSALLTVGWFPGVGKAESQSPPDLSLISKHCYPSSTQVKPRSHHPSASVLGSSGMMMGSEDLETMTR